MAAPTPIVKVFTHEGHDIYVPFTGDAYFNATAAAKPFGKEPKEWLKTKDAKRYLEALPEVYGIKPDQLVITERDSLESDGDILMHPKLGIEFARWLSVEFAFWMDMQIYDLCCQDRDAAEIAETQRYLMAHGMGASAALELAKRMKAVNDAVQAAMPRNITAGDLH